MCSNLIAVTELKITEKNSSCGCGEHDAELPELDARVIPHAIRHAAVHGVVGSLRFGAAFVLVAPHDPKPLLAEISKNYGDKIEISYVQKGPEAWKLKMERV